MDQFKKYYLKVTSLVSFLMISFLQLYAQPNCNSFLYKKDTLQYKACKLVEGIDSYYYQFSKEFQEKYDKALEICPYFDYAYKEKAVAFLKSGDMLTWKELIDKAVKYNPENNLGYRAWCRYQFFRDYKGAIDDINRLEAMINYDIGYGANGDYHLTFTKAFCYSGLNQKEKAIEIMEKQLKKTEYSVGLYDYYQLGVTYFQVEDYIKALYYFEKQNEVNDLAETEYYLGQIYKITGNLEKYMIHKKIALNLYEKGVYLEDPYTHHFNKVFYETILNN